MTNYHAFTNRVRFFLIPESHSRRKAGQMQVECGGLDFLRLWAHIHSPWGLTDKTDKATERV